VSSVSFGSTHFGWQHVKRGSFDELDEVLDFLLLDITISNFYVYNINDCACALYSSQYTIECIYVRVQYTMCVYEIISNTSRGPRGPGFSNLDFGIHLPPIKFHLVGLQWGHPEWLMGLLIYSPRAELRIVVWYYQT
jgi:hypothetical protein